MRSEPKQIVNCDKCGDEIELDLCALAGGGWDDRYADAQLKRNGWRTMGDEDICDSCIDDEAEDEE
jgi:hypothetical protein